MTIFRYRMTRLGRLNHVGVTTRSIEQWVALYRIMMGTSGTGAPLDKPEQGVRVCFVDARNIQLDLIEPLDEASPIAAILERNPLGEQHRICFEVADVCKAGSCFQGKGAWMYAPDPHRRARDAETGALRLIR